MPRLSNKFGPDFSVVQVTPVEKRESQEHFSASAYGLGFKKFSLDSLFSTLVKWTTLQSDKDKFVLGLGSTIIETKYYRCTLSAIWTVSYTPSILLKQTDAYSH